MNKQPPQLTDDTISAKYIIDVLNGWTESKNDAIVWLATWLKLHKEQRFRTELLSQLEAIEKELPETEDVVKGDEGTDTRWFQGERYGRNGMIGIVKSILAEHKQELK